MEIPPKHAPVTSEVLGQQELERENAPPAETPQSPTEICRACGSVVLGATQADPPKPGTELDLPPPEASVRNTVRRAQERQAMESGVVPAGVVLRLREKAAEFSSGEDDDNMRELIEEKAFAYRFEKIAWGRQVAAQISESNAAAQP